MTHIPTPKFVLIGERIINPAEVKWAGVPERPETDGRVQIEFISGGWALMDKGITLNSVLSLLNGAAF